MQEKSNKRPAIINAWRKIHENLATKGNIGKQTRRNCPLALQAKAIASFGELACKSTVLRRRW